MTWASTPRRIVFQPRGLQPPVFSESDSSSYANATSTSGSFPTVAEKRTFNVLSVHIVDEHWVSWRWS
jgi:hypothetical protein